MEGQSLHSKFIMEGQSLHLKCTMEELSLHLKCIMEGPWILEKQIFGVIGKTQTQPQLNLPSTEVGGVMIIHFQHVNTTYSNSSYTGKKSPKGLRIGILF